MAVKCCVSTRLVWNIWSCLLESVQLSASRMVLRSSSLGLFQTHPNTKMKFISLLMKLYIEALRELVSVRCKLEETANRLSVIVKFMTKSVHILLSTHSTCTCILSLEPL